MVETAIQNSKSQSEAARWIGVSYNTYKKWAKFYELWDQHLNPQGKGIKKVSANWSVSMDKILTGELEYKLPYKVLRKSVLEFENGSLGLYKEKNKRPTKPIIPTWEEKPHLPITENGTVIRRGVRRLGDL